MIAETPYQDDTGDRSTPTPKTLTVLVPPGLEIANAVDETDSQSPVPGTSDTPSTPPMQLNSAAELTRALRSLGLSKAAAKAVTAGGWSALQKLSGEPGEPETSLADLADALRAATAELRRFGDD